MSGSRFDRFHEEYEERGVIGRGAYGVVHHVTHKKTKKEVSFQI